MPSQTSDNQAEELELLREILENTPIGLIVLDKEGRVKHMNRWQEEISKISRDQATDTFFHDTWKRLFEQGFMDGYWDLLKEGKPFNSTVHNVFPQFYDQKITAISRGNQLPSENGFVLLHDVSEEMQRDKLGIEELEDKLAEANNFLVNLIDASPNIVITTSSSGMIRSINRTGQQIFGFPENELLGTDISALIENANDFETQFLPSANGIGVELNCRKKDKQLFPARIQIRDVVTKIGKFQAKLVLISDLTWEKRLQEKLELTQKLAIYSELMAGIAHQLNNPLVGVVSFASLLLDKTDAADANKELVETIHEAAHKCQLMLSSLMKSIHQPESIFQSVNVNEILEDALSVARAEVSDPATVLEVDIHLDNNIPEVNGASFQLAEAFRNILVNAIQAMPEGGSLELRSGEANAKTIFVTISDSGEGISPENISRIYDPFFSTKRNKGTGLGLSFAFQVMKAHSARIVVDSVLEKGTSFTVYFPTQLEKTDDRQNR